MKYTAWLVPPKPLHTKLQNKINDLSEKYGGPTFEPHVTILANIKKDLSEIEEKLKSVAKNHKKVNLTLGEVSFSTTYFQNVFVRVKSTSSLLKLNMDVKKAFKMENDLYMPHISLLYGEHDMETREKAAKEIKLPKQTFSVNRITVTPATEDPSGWEHVLTIPLGKS